MNLNPQKVFDTVYLGLLEQGEAAYNENIGCCCYRDIEGRKCAIGQLIKDELYEPRFEDLAPSSPPQEYLFTTDEQLKQRQKDYVALLEVIKESLEIEELTTEDLRFLGELQSIHDDELYPHGLDTWKAEMLNLAKHYNLTVPEVA